MEMITGIFILIIIVLAIGVISERVAEQMINDKDKDEKK
jgi:uncharacterized membrane protein